MIVFDKRIRFRDLTSGGLMKMYRLMEGGAMGEHLVASGRGFIRIRIERDPAGQVFVRRLTRKARDVPEVISVGVPA